MSYRSGLHLSLQELREQQEALLRERSSTVATLRGDKQELTSVQSDLNRDGAGNAPRSHHRDGGPSRSSGRSRNGSLDLTWSDSGGNEQLSVCLCADLKQLRQELVAERQALEGVKTKRSHSLRQLHSQQEQLRSVSGELDRVRVDLRRMLEDMGRRWAELDNAQRHAESHRKEAERQRAELQVHQRVTELLMRSKSNADLCGHVISLVH